MTASILLIKHGALGDIIQAMGVLKAIRQHYKEATITMLTSPAYAGLLEKCPYVDAVWTDSRSKKRLETSAAHPHVSVLLQKQRFDLVIDLQNSDRSRWYRWRWLRHARWLARPWWAPAPASGLSGLITLCRRAGITTDGLKQADLSWLVLPKADCLSQFDLPEKYVALIPGASRQHPDKRWPYFSDLVNRCQAFGCDVVVILGPDEANLASHFSCRTLESLNWSSLASVLAHACAVVGNDTGPSHLAAHVGARGLALFGPTSAERAEIDTDRFASWQHQPLTELSAETVWSRLRWMLDSSA